LRRYIKAKLVTGLQQSHIISTSPAIVHAGREITVYYNNRNTHLDWAEAGADTRPRFSST
jgi:hypothetical protein